MNEQRPWLVPVGTVNVWLATIAAAAGAAEMTEANEHCFPDRYRKGRWLNHQGRAQLRALGADARRVISDLVLS